MPLVAVAGATGWLGGHVVQALLDRGVQVSGFEDRASERGFLHACLHHFFLNPPHVQVLALVRPTSETAALEARAAASAAGPSSLTIARVDLTAPDADAAVAAALTQAAAAAAATAVLSPPSPSSASPPPPPPVAALVDLVGLRDLAVPTAAIRAVLTHGTAALWAGARSAAVPRFVAVAGGIHRTPDGRAPNRAMAHNAAREDALADAAAQARAGGPTGLTILDPSVFFKDAAAIFSMIARSSPPSLTLINGGWDVACNPISGRDLAGALADATLEAAAAPDPPASPVTRFSVGGPEVMTFGGLADAAARALTGDAAATCRRVTLPRWVAWAAWKAAAAAGAAGSKRALGLARFLSFLWVVCTDATPGGLVGEVRVGSDRVGDLFAELAAAGAGGTAPSG